MASAFAGQAAAAWAPYRVVVVIEENHGYDQIVGNQNAHFINQLAKEGALFTDAYGVWHPSQPNYLALFPGSTQGVTDDNPVRGTPLNTPNLAAALIAHSYTFAGFSESQAGSDLPCCPRTDYTRESTILGLTGSHLSQERINCRLV
jgi:acid phosphatase